MNLQTQIVAVPRASIVIAVHSNSFRTVRGRTLVAAIFDEVSFWRDESSATPDIEVYRAVLPSLATTNGILIGISTPYRKLGLLYQKYRDYFGVDGDDILVLKGATQVFNPTLSDETIATQRAADPSSATSEWDAEFRDDLASFLDDALIDGAVEHGRPSRRARLIIAPSVMHRAAPAMIATRYPLRTKTIRSSSSTWCAGRRRIRSLIPSRSPRNTPHCSSSIVSPR
jgi:hypothetical protein